MSYVTATAVEVTLPETLFAMDDHGLIELSHLLMREVVELEMRFDLEGDMAREVEPEGTPIVHLIDRTTAGPYGGRPLP